MNFKPLLVCAVLVGVLCQCDAGGIYWGDWGFGDIWDEVEDAGEAIGDAIGDAWDWITEGDPHVLQRIGGSNKPIHYNVFGEDGETYKYIDDPIYGLTISATMKRVNPVQGLYLGAVQLSLRLSDDSVVQVELDLNGINVDGDVFPWADRVLQHSQLVQNHTGSVGMTIEISPGEVNIYFGSFQFIVMKRAAINLNMVMKTKTMEDIKMEGGILGFMRENSTINFGSSGVTVTLEDGSGATDVIPVEEEQKFWRLSNRDMENSQVYRDMLQRNLVA